MQKNFRDYPEDVTKISQTALIELMTLLKGYKDQMVLVGGWAPYFLLKKHQKSNEFKHVGSADIDFVLDPELVKTEAYDTIVDIIEKNGYQQRKDKNGNLIEFSFEKEINGKDIQVDFLSTQYPKREKKRHRIVQQDLKARTLKGAKISLKHNYEEELHGKLINNAEVTVKLRIVNLVGSLITKALALGGRSEAKDNYDIYALVSNYKKGEQSCADELKPHFKDEIVSEGVKEIEKNFEKKSSLGPVLVGTFMHPDNETARNRMITDAFMRVNRFLELIKKET